MLRTSSRLVLALALVFAIAGPVAVAQTSSSQILPLTSGWEFRQVVEAVGAEAPVWRPAEVPGDVHLDLLRNKLIPDPYLSRQRSEASVD